MNDALITQKYVVLVHKEGDKSVRQVYTDKLSADGKTIYTYRPDRTLCMKKEFNTKGQYVVTRYDSSGEKEEYHVIGGKPDQRAADLFYQGKLIKREAPSVPFYRRLKQINQKVRGE